MYPAVFPRYVSAACLLATVSFAYSACDAFAAADLVGSSRSTIQVTQPVDETKLVRLAGQTHPLARPQFDRGTVPDSLPLEHVLIQLRRSAAAEQALEKRMADLQDPHSANYHKWLSPEVLGTEFGPAAKDIQAVVQWLGSRGLDVNGVSKTGLTIDVSGSSGRLSTALHTQIHTYVVDGKTHMANSIDPSIPAVLAPVVAGVVSLNDFLPKPQLKQPGKNFTFTYQGFENFNEAPADFATIYNVTPLYTAAKPITGTGQTIAVLERTNVKPADITTFRTAFGLSSYTGTFSQIHPGAGCKNPGRNADEGEAALDAEWAGAIAPDATVLLASCADTQFNFGPLLAAQNLLDAQSPASVMSLSYGGCEAANGPGFNAYVNSVWQQAAAQGVSVYVSSGDNATAGCDDPSYYAIAGLAVNGLASTPYNVAAGGTDFLDTVENDNATYWADTNSATGKSAKSYVPEMPWNDSCASSILFGYFGYNGYHGGTSFCNSSIGSNFIDSIGGSGGASFVYTKPSWQLGAVGMPNNGRRNLPDVSLFASNGFWSHAILYCMSDAAEGGAPCNYNKPADAYNNSAGGTSFVAPQLAGVQALINQSTGSPQGNPAPTFYSLYKSEFGTDLKQNLPALRACDATAGNTAASGSCIFHDVTVGNNNVPCYGTNNCFYVAGGDYGILSTSTTLYREAYNARYGWDFTSGLGSVNVTNLVNAWPR